MAFPQHILLKKAIFLICLQKLFDFCLAILTEVLSIFGMVICTAAAYLEGSRQIHHHAVYFIAGMEVGCYLASVVSLAVIFACWIQMSTRSCSCNCICADTTCSYGDHQVEVCTSQRVKLLGSFRQTLDQQPNRIDF